MSDFSFNFAAVIFRTLIATLSDFHFEGAENIPKSGGCLFVANHISHFDPTLFGSFSGRPIDYMTDLPLLQIPIAGAILKSWNAFPVDRTKVDRGAIKTALHRLKKGRVVGIFPERGIRTDKESILGGAELGLGTISLWQMAQVPLIPAIVIGSDQLYQWRNLYRRPRLFVSYGKPLPPPLKTEDREIGRNRLTEALHQLYRQMADRYHFLSKELPMTAQERWAMR